MVLPGRRLLRSALHSPAEHALSGCSHSRGSPAQCSLRQPTKHQRKATLPSKSLSTKPGTHSSTTRPLSRPSEVCRRSVRPSEKTCKSCCPANAALSATTLAAGAARTGSERKLQATMDFVSASEQLRSAANNLRRALKHYLQTEKPLRIARAYSDACFHAERS
jgi:hypothetical protein